MFDKQLESIITMLVGYLFALAGLVITILYFLPVVELSSKYAWFEIIVICYLTSINFILISSQLKTHKKQ